MSPNIIIIIIIIAQI